MARTYQEINAYKEKNEIFLAENAKKDDIFSLNNGLQYKIIKRSKSGIKPKSKGRVVVHYAGKLINGKEFDNSFKRKKPETFRLNEVIKGFSAALREMEKGDYWQIYIPYQLGYGGVDCGKDIPAYSTLIFDIELVDIK